MVFIVDNITCIETSAFLPHILLIIRKTGACKLYKVDIKISSSCILK